MHTKVKGITLLELLTSITIMAVLLGVGLPAFNQFVARHTASVAINRISGAVNFARYRAVTLGHTVTICPLAGTQSCGKQWHRGLVIFADRDSDGALDADTDRLLRVYPAFAEGSTVSWTAFGSNRYVRFTALGFTLNQNGTFRYCPPSGDPRNARIAILNRGGRLRLGRDTDQNGIPEDSQGNDIECRPKG